MATIDRVLRILAIMLATAGATAVAAGSAAAQDTACPPVPTTIPAGAKRVTLTRDPATHWQAPGGEVRFTLHGAGIGTAGVTPLICFRWHSAVEAQWHATPPVRQIQVTDAGADDLTFGVTMPAELNADAPSWFVWGKKQPVAFTGLGFVPEADMHVVLAGGSADWRTVDFVEQVGVTNRWFALIPAGLAFLTLWALLLLWGWQRRVAGGIFLSIISTTRGFASLSQLQAIIWSFVIGVGVTYIMALSGRLIDVPLTALSLLGIAGVVTVAAKVQGAGADRAPPATPPGAVTSLALVGAASNTAATLSWTAPTGADPETAYVVQVRPVGTVVWLTVAEAVPAPPYTVTNLLPATAYQFQVYGVSRAGTGPASAPVQTTTAAAGGAPLPGLPDPVTGVATKPGAQPDTQVVVAWTMPAGAAGCVVQYRVAGTWPWSTAEAMAQSGVTVSGLTGATAYEFQVSARNAAGLTGPPSAVVAARTAPRQPRWSDLVVTGDGSTTIDITRVQMLLFTMIAAVFVAMTMFDEGRIPDIPAGILTLVGLSNALYIGAKFAPGGH